MPDFHCCGDSSLKRVASGGSASPAESASRSPPDCLLELHRPSWRAAPASRRTAPMMPRCARRARRRAALSSDRRRRDGVAARRGRVSCAGDARPSRSHSLEELRRRRRRMLGACMGPSRRELDVERGECLAVLGAPGAGTTTLLYCLAGLRLPTLLEQSRPTWFRYWSERREQDELRPREDQLLLYPLISPAFVATFSDRHSFASLQLPRRPRSSRS